MDENKFIELLIRQTCRHLYIDEMGLPQSTGGLSADVAKSLSERSGIGDKQMLLKLPQTSLGGLIPKLAEGLNDGFMQVDKSTFLDVLMNIRESTPSVEKCWLDVQHYMYYIYRNFRSKVPDTPRDSPCSMEILAELRESIKILLADDESQLFLRLYALIKDYCTFVMQNYCTQEHANSSFFSYEAMLSAARTVSSTFPELEQLLQKNYSGCWMDFNHYIFMHQFFHSEQVQNKMKGDMFEVLMDLSILWSREFKRLHQLIASSLLPPTSEFYRDDAAMMEEHQKILSQNFWISRSQMHKDSLDLSRLDHQLFRILVDKDFAQTPSTIDQNGQCICEDCLIAKYQLFLKEPAKKVVMDEPLSLYCRRCRVLVELDEYEAHVSEGHERVASDFEVVPWLRWDEVNKMVDSMCKMSITGEQAMNAKHGNMKMLFDTLLKQKTETAAADLAVQEKNTKNAVKVRKKTPEPPARERETKPVEVVRNGRTVQAARCRKHTCRSLHTITADEGCDHLQDVSCNCACCDGPAAKKKNELRDKLRKTLRLRREHLRPADQQSVTQGLMDPQRVPPITTATGQYAAPPPTPTPDNNNLHDLVNYIEGNTTVDKVALAEKKAAKKDRQRKKRDEERRREEEEERRKAEEARKIEEERKKAELLAVQLEEKAKKKSLQNQLKKERRRTRAKEAAEAEALEQLKKNTVVEETIPAMVTIKRVAENVTITLKGSTPDQDKLLYTLVNGADTEILKPVAKDDASQTSKKKKKKKQQEAAVEPPKPKEVKVTLAVDPPAAAVAKKEAKLKKPPPPAGNKGEEVAMPMLKLPPGITITKVDGPISAAGRYLSATGLQEPGSALNMGKSGVIVVDTEKLIQQSSGAPAAGKLGKSKAKKKKKKDAPVLTAFVPSPDGTKAQMVTLKNPIFANKADAADKGGVGMMNGGDCAPASIFTNENGMVTIRSSRLQQSIDSGIANPNSMPVHFGLPDLKPVMGPEAAPAQKPSGGGGDGPKASAPMMTTFNAQEILSGLPGIEITKVDKRCGGKLGEQKKDAGKASSATQTAQVTIIPSTATNGNSLDKDDWSYDDSVFAPRDVPEDDMDADERELEAFKRFCQQSVPPKQKQIVHLNVKDIVLKKKNEGFV